MQSNCEAVDHYAANNPVKYTDPTGEFAHIAIAAGIGIVSGIVATVISDIVYKERGSISEYIGAAIGGAITGAVLATTGNAPLAGAIGGFIGDFTSQMIENNGNIGKVNVAELAIATTLSAVIGGALKSGNIKGVTVGRNSMVAVTKQITTKYGYNATNVAIKTAAKMAVSRTAQGTLAEGATLTSILLKALDHFSSDLYPEDYTVSNICKKINEILGEIF